MTYWFDKGSKNKYYYQFQCSQKAKPINQKYLRDIIIINPTMTEKKIVLLSLIAVALTAGALYYLEPDSENLQCIARTTIIARGQDWVDKHVPYSQSGSHDGYRTDCSGFVSMCWQLSKPGLTTSTMGGVSHSIAKNDLQPGDALLCEGKHIALFAGWSDSTKTHYTCMQEEGTQWGTVKRVVTYPYGSGGDSCYHPVRLNTVC